MTAVVTDKQISWTRITPEADATHGKPCTRSSHGLSLVRGGSRLILLGGEHVARTPLEGSNRYWAADKTDANKWQWRLIASADSGPPERIAHAQAAHQDQFVYIFGGRAGITMEEKAMNDLWKLDCSGEPGTETWSQVEATSGTPPEARSFHKMICVGNNLFVFGGCTAGHGRAADLHRFDLESKTWYSLGTSALRGRGGPNLLPMAGGTKVGVVAGFAGEETADGQLFDIAAGKWNDQLLESELEGMRPRSVCVSGSFPSSGYSVIFGGEVDPPDRGHEGAGAFENDVVVLDETSGAFLASIKAKGGAWPQTRGWSDSAAVDSGNGSGQLYIFGGLSGDDKNPERLDDLWVLDVQKA
ncbi:Nitrile-specifier protein [Seminavis robusta]|uniref:Nitrile-specifier protein n=1 Tax=Seminavis robusta TaxID=568900 RepID=A0A9N8EXP0_9STRA|nr:Nitrile-specifier protein [Seminavis robusta]|eukprot:Sro2009_g310760.1 Nitrile-specifier protein (358) ;mRNA; f:18327-19400